MSFLPSSPPHWTNLEDISPDLQLALRHKSYLESFIQDYVHIGKLDFLEASNYWTSIC